MKILYDIYIAKRCHLYFKCISKSIFFAVFLSLQNSVLIYAKPAVA